MIAHCCKPTTLPSEAASKGIIYLLNKHSANPEIWTHEVIDGDKKMIFMHIGSLSHVRQEILQMAYARGPSSYLDFDQRPNQSWTQLEQGVLCFETSEQRPRPYPDRRVLQWKIEGGNEFVPKDRLYVEKIKTREELWRRECEQAILACENEIEGGGLPQATTFAELIESLSNYCSLFIDSFIDGDSSNNENYFYRTLKSLVSGSVWSLVDSPYTASCFHRIHRAFLKHTDCYLEGRFTDDCVTSFIQTAGYLEIKDVHRPELYDRERAKKALEKFFQGMNPSTWSRELERFREDNNYRKSHYDNQIREVKSSKNANAELLVEFAALSVVYDETLRDLRTRSLVMLRETMLRLGRDLPSTSLEEITHDLKKASKMIHP